MKTYRIEIRQLVPEVKVEEVTAPSLQQARTLADQLVRDGDGFEFDSKRGIEQRWIASILELEP